MRLRRLSDKHLLFIYFFSLIFLGTFLLALPLSHRHSHISILDALFTTVSAVCVTGLATVSTSSYSTFGQMVLLFLIQAGGLGYITFSTIFLFLPHRRISFSNMTILQQYYGNEEPLNGRRILKSILSLTFGIEFIGFIFLFIGLKEQGLPSPFYSAFFHSISAFCNAGFSLYDDSLTQFSSNSIFLFGISFLIIMGGLGFMVIWNSGRFIKSKGKIKLKFHTKIMLIFTPSLIIFGALLYFIFEKNHLLQGLSLSKAIGMSFFQSITTRTAGFNAIDQGQLSIPSLIVTLQLMLIGGGSGSTAGGLKVSTMFLMFLVLTKGLNAKGESSFLNRRITKEQLQRASLYFMKAISILLLSAFALSLSFLYDSNESFSFMEILYEVTSALGTVGLSMGMTSSLNTIGKIIIIITMFAGRIGLFAMILPDYDRGIKKFIKYPKGEVLIG